MRQLWTAIGEAVRGLGTWGLRAELAALALIPASALAAVDPSPGCEAAVAADPEAKEGWQCLARAVPFARLEEVATEYPDVPWGRYFLGWVRWGSGDERVPAWYGEAAAQFARRADRNNELKARTGQIRSLDGMGRGSEAQEVLDGVIRAAGRDPPEEFTLWSGLEQGKLLTSRGEVAAAVEFLEPLEPALFASSIPDDRRRQLDWLGELTALMHELGRRDSAQAYQQRWLGLARELDNTQAEASALYMGAAILADRERPGTEEQLERELREALEAAHAAGNVDVEVKTLRLLGKLVGGEAGRGYLQRCIELTANGGGYAESRGYCLGALAAAERERDPERALELSEQALETVAGVESPWPRLHLLVERNEVLWAALPRAEAVAKALEALDSVEALRRRQPPGSDRARVHANWLAPYQWLAGRLLQPEDGRPAGDEVELSFEVTERMRARALLEELVGERAASDRWHRPSATLDQVQAALDQDQALLSYQVARWTDVLGDFGGGSWLLVVTRDRVRVLALSDRVDLEDPAGTLIWLDDPGADAGLQSHLYRELVGPALAALPERIRRLVIVPAGRLHSLSFPALRAAAGPKTALIDRFEVSVVPSAALWLHWKREPPVPAGGDALVLAAPRLAEPQAGPAGGAAGRREPEWVRTPLPGARREGRAIVRRIGGELLLGADASEAALEARSGRPGCAVLHLGAHAVADLESPGRSAVFLAPGGGEDGRLEPAEIASLDLGCRLVVLATCVSAAGEVVHGEGAMSLARAFFESGAEAVVASLWRVSDLDVTPVMERFYVELAAGRSVAAALAAAQRAQLGDEGGGTAWAGLTVLGNGDLVPFPGGLPARSPLSPWWPPWWPVAPAVALGLAAVILAGRIGRRRRPEPAGRSPGGRPTRSGASRCGGRG